MGTGGGVIEGAGVTWTLQRGTVVGRGGAASELGCEKGRGDRWESEHRNIDRTDTRRPEKEGGG